MKKNKILLDQIDNKIINLKNIENITIPGNGWINAIRSALNMTLNQLGQRLSLPRQNVRAMEERENKGTISLNVLRKFAEAMNMKFVYGFIPNDGSLDKMIEKRAYEIANEIVGRTSVNMNLEDQKNSESRLKKAVKERADEIKREMPKYLWDQNKIKMFTIKDHIPEKELALFCEKYKIKSLSLFGSAVRNELKPESDIDILVDFAKGQTPGMITFMTIQNELTAKIGRQVDLRTRYDLSDQFRDNVVAEARTEYVSGR
ncbi:MAG: mobile mystery protein A [Candidatus Delongbacteria bacterium]|jgi:predicted DNA-binding mobile mystery protein A|nr:mobile mystery protein A [Candidatus Delongbacteria bacterium]